MYEGAVIPAAITRIVFIEWLKQDSKRTNVVLTDEKRNALEEKAILEAKCCERDRLHLDFRKIEQDLGIKGRVKKGFKRTVKNSKMQTKQYHAKMKISRKKAVAKIAAEKAQKS